MKKIILLLVLYSVNSFSSVNTNCSYDFDTKKIENLDIKEFPYNKKWIKDELEYKIHIEKEKFSEISDFLTVKNKLGHKITYSLKCKI